MYRLQVPPDSAGVLPPTVRPRKAEATPWWCVFAIADGMYPVRVLMVCFLCVCVRYMVVPTNRGGPPSEQNWCIYVYIYINAPVAQWGGRGGPYGWYHYTTQGTYHEDSHGIHTRGNVSPCSCPPPCRMERPVHYVANMMQGVASTLHGETHTMGGYPRTNIRTYIYMLVSSTHST